MLTLDQLRQDNERLNAQLSEYRVLVQALDFLVDDLATETMQGRQAKLRDAIIGVTHALTREVGLQ